MGINSAFYNGLSGLNSYSTALSVVSDNVANANTTAFKSNNVLFGDIVSSYYGTLVPDTERQGAGNTVMTIASNFTQGIITNTSNWCDLAISGDGFFVVKETTTAGDIMHYTRDGSFHVAVDPTSGAGFLVNAQGYRVQAGTGADIPIDNYDTYINFYVDSDGQITGVQLDPATGTTTEVPIPAAETKIRLVTFANKNGLIREGTNLYTKGPNVGMEYNNTDNPAMFGEFMDFSLESSNVDLATEMVSMIMYQASYNANSKSITTSRDMLESTINLVR